MGQETFYSVSSVMLLRITKEDMNFPGHGPPKPWPGLPLLGLSQNWARFAVRGKRLSSALQNSSPHCKELRKKNAKTKKKTNKSDLFLGGLNSTYFY